LSQELERRPRASSLIDKKLYSLKEKEEKLSDELLKQKFTFFNNPTLFASPLRWLRRVP
jgi:hypothetical protein